MANYANGVNASSALNVNSVYNMIEKVARQTITSAKANDDIFKDFEKGTFENGVALEQAVIKMATSYAYSATANEFIASNPTVVAKYFNTWNDRQWGAKVTDLQVRSILKGDKKLSDVAGEVVNSLIEGEKDERYTALLGGFTQARTGELISSSGTATTTAQLVSLIRDTVWALKFSNTSYYGTAISSANLKGRTPMERIRIVLPYTLYNLIDLDVLANAINLEKVDLMAKIIITDDTNKYAYVCDVEAFGRVSRVHEMTSEYSATQLATHYYLTDSSMFYYSPLFKCAYIDATAL